MTFLAQNYLLARDEIGLGLPPAGKYSGYSGGKRPKNMKFLPGNLVDNLDIVARRLTAEDIEKKIW